MPDKAARRGRPRKPPSRREIEAEALVREALRPRAIDTSGGGFDLVRSIYELGWSDGQRAMAKEGAAARKRPNLISKMNRWMVYEGVMQGNPQVWRHPHALQHLRMLQQALVAKGIKKASLATIRKDLAEMKRNTARAGRQAQAPG
jgi:hypothetical protein